MDTKTHDYVSWDSDIAHAEQMNAIYEVIGVQDRAVTGDCIVPHLHRLYRLLKEHYGQRLD